MGWGQRGARKTAALCPAWGGAEGVSGELRYHVQRGVGLGEPVVWFLLNPFCACAIVGYFDDPARYVGAVVDAAVGPTVGHLKQVFGQMTDSFSLPE